MLQFTWDAAKNEANLLERGFDSEFASLNELTVVYTDRLDAAGRLERRIISARRSNRYERQAYQEAIQTS